ncbi:unnamed protein product [Moneuplotes crassus]|uniref:Peptidase A1 domain-containing protein n=1 Tax=Euplotes crassus TaxID=5936 RepID=A0AAD1UK78_EUPCR|nr:unnamed protein product [Moneuplotes crassus]
MTILLLILVLISTSVLCTISEGNLNDLSVRVEEKGKIFRLVKHPNNNLNVRSARKQYNIPNKHQKSLLQLKYQAEDYFESGEARDDTSDGEVSSPMRDLPFNGFTSVVGVGNPPQTFYCIFDTGSSVMFVNSFACDNQNCGINPQFQSANSETYDNSNAYTETIFYGGGYLDGTVIRDSVYIETMEVQQQDIALVTSEDDGSTPNFSCVIGLSFPELSPNGESLLFDNMIDQGLLNEALFTTYYYNDLEHADLYFGGILDKYYEGEINYVPVQVREHWNIKVDDVLIDGVSTGICSEDEGCIGLVDTGTNSNSIEGEAFDVVTNAIFGGSDLQYGFPCNMQNVDLPDISYVIGGVSYEFDYHEYTIEDFGYCQLDMFDMDVFNEPGRPSIVLGVSFLKKYFTVWDRRDAEAPQMGFAVKAHLEIPYEEFYEVDAIPDNSEFESQ